MNAPSPTRWELLGGPGGYMNALPVGDPRRTDSRYRSWQTLATINRPMTKTDVRWAQGWALRTFELV